MEEHTVYHRKEAPFDMEETFIQNSRRKVVAIVFLSLFSYLLFTELVNHSLSWTPLTQAIAAADEKKVLTQSDFEYIGAFLLPTSGVNGDPIWGQGLTHRYVNGELRMFAYAWNAAGPQNMYEVRVPAPSLTSSPTATVVRNWGDVAGNKRIGQMFGLYWDEQDQRMYWNDQNVYNTCCPDDPGMGYSILNDATGGITPVGAWRFTGRGTKATNTCVLPIPQWFADAYTGGMRLGAGCGGYQSIVATGPGHLGPALTAFSPPDITTNPDGSSLSFVDLVGYPFQNNPIDCTKRATRDTNYVDDFDGCDPVNGVGRWSWSDRLWQSAVWIDLPDKSGLVYFATLAYGREWYETSTLHAMGSTHWWYVYDPADLAAVAQGAKEQYEIQAKYTWPVEYPGLSYPLPRWDGGDPGNLVSGVTYDSVTRRVFVAVRFAGNGGATKVYVYEVNSAFSNPLSAPTGLRLK